MKREQVAVSMWSVHREYYHNGWSVFDFLDLAERLGVRQVELLNNFWRNEAEEFPRLRETLHARGFRVAAWAVNNDFARDEYAAEVTEILDGIDIARAFGAPTVRVFAAHPHPGVDLDRALDAVVRGLKEAAPAAERAGVTLALENHGLLAGKIHQIVGILDQVGSPAVQANVDIGNFLLVDEDPLEAVSRLEGRIAHVHAKDMKPVADGGWTSLAGKHYVGAAIGEGVVPVGPVLRRLEESGYGGYLSLEFEGSGDETEGVSRSLDALFRLVGETA